MQPSHFASQASISLCQCFECSSKALNVIQNAWQQPTVVSVRYFVQHFNLVKLDKSFISPMLHHWITVYLCFSFLISSIRYVEEHIQRTGVAIETQGFSFVTSGRKRESLTVSPAVHKQQITVDIILRNTIKCGFPFVFLTSPTCNKSLS